MAHEANTQGSVESLDEYRTGGKKATQIHNRWADEITAAAAVVKKFQKQGSEVINKFLNSKTNSDRLGGGFKLNLFHANIRTIQSMMFGKLPEIKFSRTNMDFNDDTARVAGMLLERMLNADIGTPNDLYSNSLRQNLEDRLLPGLGVSRVRYEYDEEEVDVPAVIDPMTGWVVEPASKQTKITNERAQVDYVHWRDYLWSPARVWQDVRWEAFRTLMTRDQLISRFGKEKGSLVPLTVTQLDDGVENAEDPDNKQDMMMRGEVWEIWSKEDEKVYWFNKDVKSILDVKDDPLGLTGFFPNPEPMTSNVTTTEFLPIADYVMAQDLYLEIDTLEARISKLTEAVKVIGAYDQSAEGLEAMFNEGRENELIPVDNWAMFGEKGGLAGAIDWLPVKDIAEVLLLLVDRRNDVKALLFEVTGMSDIMRGAKAAGGAVSATERALEARFASVHIQALQDEFAKYATDLIRLRAEVVSKHFQPETIAKQANVQAITADQENIGPAIQLIKQDNALIWRIEVKPESVAMVDYAQLKEERTSYITALATFLQSAAPLVEMEPASTPVLLEMLKWGLAGFKGSDEVEGVLDQAIKVLVEQSKKGGQENDKPSDQQIKAQAEQAAQQHDEKTLQATQNFEREKWQHEVQVLQLEKDIRERELQVENNNNIRKEQAQAQLNMQEEQNETDEFIIREREKARLNTEPANDGA